jgi:Fe-S-cluster containining protein
MGDGARIPTAANGTSNGSGHGTGIAELVASAVAELDRQVERGSFFTQAVLQRGFSRLDQAETLLTRLVEALADRGVIDPEELGYSVTRVPAGTPEAPGGPGDDEELPDVPPPAEPGEGGIAWPSVALRVDDPEASAGLEVDCDARMHICKAVCCRLKFPLSCDEVDSGTVKWDLGHPYVIRHESSGYCTHNDTATGGCRIYEDRPGVCRRYSCAGDTRIWSDFEHMVLNQDWIDEHLGARDLHVSAVMPAMEETGR